MSEDESLADMNKGSDSELTLFEQMVSKEERRKFSRWEETLGYLEKNPNCVGAASTLFWQFYCHMGQIGDIPTFCNRIHELLRLTSPPGRSDIIRQADNRTSAAFVKLHLVTLLLMAVSRHIWGTVELSETLCDIGERAFATLPIEEYGLDLVPSKSYQEPQGDVNIDWENLDLEGNLKRLADERELRELNIQSQRPLCWVSACFHLESFRCNRGIQDEERLASFARAASLLAASGYDGLEETEVGLLTEPHEENPIEEAAHCFESIVTHKSLVSNWKGVSDSCRLIAQSLQPLENCSILWDSIPMTVNGFVWVSQSEYWNRASTIAELEMSPSDLVQERTLERRSQHEYRMINDFLGEELWRALNEDSRNCLIAGEVILYDALLTGRKGAFVNEMRLTFEYELQELIFERAQPLLDPMLANQKNREKWHVLSNSTSGLNLNEMAKLLLRDGDKNLSDVPPLSDAIAELGLQHSEYVFLTNELPKYLSELSEVRNMSEHRRQNRDFEERSFNVRRKALGIGQPGYLRRLLETKLNARRKDKMGG